MDTWIWLLIAAFVIADGIGMFFLIRHLRGSRQQAPPSSGDDAPPQVHM